MSERLADGERSSSRSAASRMRASLRTASARFPSAPAFLVRSAIALRLAMWHSSSLRSVSVEASLDCVRIGYLDLGQRDTRRSQPKEQENERVSERQRVVRMSLATRFRIGREKHDENHDGRDADAGGGGGGGGGRPDDDSPRRDYRPRGVAPDSGLF